LEARRGQVSRIVKDLRNWRRWVISPFLLVNSSQVFKEVDVKRLQNWRSSFGLQSNDQRPKEMLLTELFYRKSVRILRKLIAFALQAQYL